ncbi:MAG: hypothetical protein ACXACB_11440 [Promethearchaeota archaeon]
MRRNLKIILFVIAALVVTGGTAFGIIVAVTWGSFEYSDTFYYKPAVPDPIEKVSFISDVGSIRIKYNSTPTDNYIKLNLDISIKGGFVEGKSFSDFFKPIVWSNESASTTTFTIENKGIAWALFPVFRNITIEATLRTDINYDIAALTSTGSIHAELPDNINLNTTDLETSTGSISVQTGRDISFNGRLKMKTSTGSIALFSKKVNFTKGLRATTSTGSLTLNFSNCVMGNDLTGKVSTGSISINSYNLFYTQDCDWDIETSTGSVNIDLLQYVDMGADVSGSIETSTGSITLTYKDNQASVGGSFHGTWSTGSYSRSSSGGGFSPTNNNPYYSLDYSTATNTYTLDLATSTGSINVDGTSL